MLEKNQAAPNFSSPNQDDKIINLADFNGKSNVVLYFYPKDDTPGCTIEANDFTRLAGDFANFDTVVIGVSKDSCESHAAFIKKFDLKLDLLADTSGAVCQAYDVWREKIKNGEIKMAIFRSTFIIDKDSHIVEAEYGVSHEDHAQAILNRIQRLHQQGA